MLNPLESYAHVGFTAGVARNQGDESRARFESDYAKRMWNLEKAEEKRAARHAFDVAYKHAREIKATLVPRIYG